MFRYFSVVCGKRPKHNCSLNGSDPFGHKKMNPLKKLFVKLVTVSEIHPLHQQILRSSGAVAFERRRQIQTSHWYVIHPFSIFSVVWQITFTVIITLQMLNLPWTQNTVFAYSFGHYCLLIDCLCLLNVFVNFFSGYVDEDSMEIVLNHRLIVRKYSGGYFIFDLLGTLPIVSLWHIFSSYAFFSDENIRADIFALLHMLQIRLFFIFSRTTLAIFRLNEYYIDAYRVVWQVFMAIHFLACMTSYVPFFIHGSAVMFNNETWLNQLPFSGDETPLNVILPKTLSGEENDGGLVHIEHTAMDPLHYYVICLCRTLTLMYGLGFGKDPPRNQEDMYMAIIYMIIGVFVNFYVLEKWLKFRGWVKSPSVKYHMLLKQVNQYMRRKQLPPNIQRKVRLFYEYRFDKRFFEERAILANLSKNLRAEIRLLECRRLVMESVLFRNAPLAVVEKILVRLKHDVYLPNDVMIKAGQYGDCMFFLVSGTVAVLSRAGDEMLHLKDGAFFGELALLSEDERRMATVIAIEVCEVYRLDKKDFQQVVRPMRMLYGFIQRVAEKRLSNLVGIEEMYKRLHATTVGSSFATPSPSVGGGGNLSAGSGRDRHLPAKPETAPDSSSPPPPPPPPPPPTATTTTTTETKRSRPGYKRSENDSEPEILPTSSFFSLH